MRSEFHGRLMGWVRYRRLLDSSGGACPACERSAHVRTVDFDYFGFGWTRHGGGSVDSETSLTLCALSNWASSSWRPAYSIVQSRFCAENWWPLDSPSRGHRRRMLITFIAPRVLLINSVSVVANGATICRGNTARPLMGRA